MFPQDDTVASWTGHKITIDYREGSVGLHLAWLHDTVSSYLRHTAVSSGNNPVLVDQGATAEVESSAILGVRRCIRTVFDNCNVFIFTQSA